MSSRFAFCAFLFVAVAAVSFTVWSARRDRQAAADRNARTAPVAESVPPAAAAPVPRQDPATPDPLPADASVTAREIYARGKARMAEDEKIRQSIAEGQPAPLPEHLRVADLPLETPPPRPVRR